MSVMRRIDRTIYVKSQLMRVRIIVDPETGVWSLGGTPANQSAPGDETVPTQFNLLEIYEMYGLYKIGLIDKIMRPIEAAVGRFINSRRKRKHWNRQGR